MIKENIFEENKETQSSLFLAQSFVTLQLCSAVFRFIIEKKEDLEKTTVITTGIFVESVNVKMLEDGTYKGDLFSDL